MARLRFIELSALLLASGASFGRALANDIFTSRSSDSSLPIIDLGYEVYQASAFNSTGQYYTFSNIRYAAPPVGSLRFAAPQPPSANRSVVQDGLTDRICPQAYPDWINTSNQFVPRYLLGDKEFDESSFNFSIPTPEPDPRETEDCLFLDISVPKAIYDNAGKTNGAPVVVWIHGGGYTVGWKTAFSNPAGLIHASQNNGELGIIFVAINYRLGAFGFLGGPTVQEDGTANAGLYDQQMALEWVQTNIAKFGGDAQQVTIHGESAGAGSIIHHLTAYGGSGPILFTQAILQSPPVVPLVSSQLNEDILTTFLDYAGASTLQEARSLSSATLQAANRRQVAASPYGAFTYSPTLDDNLIPASPAQLLQQGRFHKSVRMFIAHNENEGLIFTPPFLRNQSDIEHVVTTLFPSLSDEPQFVTDLLNNLYPEDEFSINSTSSQRTCIARTSKFKADALINCNFYFLATAYTNTYAYRFAIEPALHGNDVAYTYYNGPSSDVTAPAMALKMQSYITNFIRTGSPNDSNLPSFDIYGKEGQVIVIDSVDIYKATDGSMETQCSWLERVQG
ncbi:acetylcholinesterase precursor [Trichoderma cornu-damae]|uniref:Carboxylic ester hydrolase n=1 Tax=Trichoderma cornu-damae TaxID=654480 RepID=A0A9P8QHW1_9HYPO|nr:acetylcholinesterase precursor [Trichoderma cornu-damae]